MSKFNSRDINVAASSFYYDEQEINKLFKVYDHMSSSKYTIFDGMFELFIEFYKKFNKWSEIEDKEPEERKIAIVQFITAYANEIPNKLTSEDFLFWLEKVVSTNAPMELADDIKDHWMWDSFKTSIDQLDNSSISFKDKLSVRPDFIDDIDDDEFVSLGDIKYTAISSSKYSTGLPDLDNVVHLVDSNFVIIAARPGVGKSLMMINQAIKNAMLGYKCLYISLEMNSGQINKRIMNHCAGYNIEESCKDDSGVIDTTACALQYENLLAQDRMQTIQKNLDFYIPRTNNAETILAKIERRIERNHYNIIFIDYVQLLRYQ